MTHDKSRRVAALLAKLRDEKILETILVKVDVKTLLLSQRVNRLFRAVIEHSALLQQALFFQLAPDDGRRFGNDGMNPLLMPHFREFDRHGTQSQNNVDNGVTIEIMVAEEGLEDTLADATGPVVLLEIWLPRYIRKSISAESSWRRMHPFQSPYLWLEGDVVAGNRRLYRDVALTGICDNLTLGEIVDLAREFALEMTRDGEVLGWTDEDTMRS